ncbi:MAG: ATP-binding cassette subfamily F protein 3 [Oceanospirillaceae bacterium]|jgi:ATP-binding cassette subfamily F protein 3
MNPMTTLLQLINLGFAFNSQSLFSDLNLNINKNDKIGLVGHNGCGKSSLLALINQKLPLDKGEIRKPHAVTTATVEQFVAPSLLPLSLASAVSSALPTQDPAAIQWRVQSILIELGFNDQQFDIKVQDLSGGQQNLMLLARAFIQEPDLLLLDEPGNHMDILAMTKLQHFLKFNCRCAFMIISHDRYLLNEVCNKTVFLRDGQCQKFELPFDPAKTKLAEQDQQSQQRLEVEQKEITRLKSSAKRLAILGRENDSEKLSRQAKSIEKRALKLDAQKTHLAVQSPLKLQMKSLEKNALHAKKLLSISNCTVNAPNSRKKLLHINELIIKPGERIALLGVNGVGKSSLLELVKKAYHQQFPAQEATPISSINAEIIDHQITFNPQVTFGYYDQTLQLLDKAQSRIDWLREHSNATEEQIKSALIKAGIHYLEFDRLVNSLSGGEKSRMMFLTFTLNQPNFIVLDEPTNHIDLAGKTQLSQQLEQSGATLFITSHDRYFLEQISTRWLLIQKESVIELSSADIFYQQLLQLENDTTKLAKPVLQSTNTDLTGQGAQPMDEGQLLERIEILEKKLALEKAQTLKRQKPALQQALQFELTELWSLM